MMNSRKQKFMARIFMLALVAFLALPTVAFAQGKGKGRGKPTDVFVNGHDARDGRWDKDNQRRRNESEADWRRRIRNRDNDRWDDRDGRNRDGRNGDWRNGDTRYGRNRSNDGYGNYGGSFDLRQTALNAGFNSGVQEGRKDRSRGESFNFHDESDFQRATEDYSSRLGDRNLYSRYYRQAFENGYRDGYAGY
jgi:hypothetical protein